MGLTSEQVHWIFGAVLIAVAVLLILRDTGRIAGRWIDYLLPLLLAAFGLEMLLDPLVHGDAAPANYAAETAQHFGLGLLLIAASAAEFLRTRRGGSGRLWRLPLAAAMAIAAVIFWVHAQHDSAAPMILLMTQHRMIAATLAVAAVAALLVGPEQRGSGQPPPAISFLMLLLGVQLLIYTEGSSLFGRLSPAAHPGHRP
jgi:hypothetical protein